MKRSEINITGILLVLLAIPPWIFLLGGIPGGLGFAGNPFRHLIAPIALFGTTAALWRLLRTFPNAWPLSAFVAGYGLIASMFIAAAIARVQ